MNPMMILMLMLMMHQMMGRQNPQKGPSQAPGSFGASGPQIQAAQGPRGRVAGHYGALAPGTGGLASMLNASGSLPGQQPGGPVGHGSLL